MQSVAPVGQATSPVSVPAVPGLAIASLVCGILGFLTLGITGVAAVVCGHLALAKIKRFPQLYRGRGLAVTGLILGYSILVIIGGAFFAIRGAAEQARPIQAKGDINALLSGLELYKINTGRYPSSQQGLKVLVDARVLSRIRQDPWQHDYIYHFPGRKNPNEPEIISCGGDGREGTADDLNSQDF